MQTSPKSTGTEWGGDTGAGSGAVSPTDRSQAQLEADLQSERDGRREERFYWVFVIVMLFDVIVFALTRHIYFMIIFMIVQLPALVGFAAFCGVDQVRVMLHDLYSRWSRTPPPAGM